MQAPRLTATQRSWMNDPEGFAKRMQERAAELWLEEYRVTATDETGVFTVHSPKGETYRVNVLTDDCTCAYQQKAGIPQVSCKHIQGLPFLVSEQLDFWKMLAQTAEKKAAPNNFSAERAVRYWEEYNSLKAAWDAAEALKIEAQWQEFDAAAEFGEIESDRAERLIREAGFMEY